MDMFYLDHLICRKTIYFYVQDSLDGFLKSCFSLPLPAKRQILQDVTAPVQQIVWHENCKSK